MLNPSSSCRRRRPATTDRRRPPAHDDVEHRPRPRDERHHDDRVEHHVEPTTSTTTTSCADDRPTARDPRLTRDSRLRSGLLVRVVRAARVAPPLDVRRRTSTFSSGVPCLGRDVDPVHAARTSTPSSPQLSHVPISSIGGARYRRPAGLERRAPGAYALARRRQPPRRWTDQEVQQCARQLTAPAIRARKVRDGERPARHGHGLRRARRPHGRRGRRRPDPRRRLRRHGRARLRRHPAGHRRRPRPPHRGRGPGLATSAPDRAAKKPLRRRRPAVDELPHHHRSTPSATPPS